MKLRATLAGIAFCASAVPVVAGAPVACAAESDTAALVVDTGESSFRYCVRLPDDSVSGIELIQLAGEQHGLQYSLGYGGQAVCRLQGVGPDGDDCFAEDPYFWGYWHGDGSGGWNWSSSGAGSYRVEPGDVEGWSWGTGQSGDSHPEPPATTYVSVCPAASEGGGGGGDNKDRAKGAEVSTETDDASSVEAGAASPEPAASEEPRARKRGRADRNRKETAKEREVAPSPEASLIPEPENAAAAAATDEPGPPAGGIVAVIATFGLAAVGALVARRRSG